MKQDEEDKEYSDVWFKALNLYNEGRVKDFLHFPDSVYATRKKISPFGYYQRYANLLFYFKKKGVLDSAMIYADSSIYIIEVNKLQEKYRLDYVHPILTKGDIYFEMHNYNEACKYYFRAKQEASKITGGYSLNEVFYCLGMAFYRQQKYAEAAEQFKESMREALKISGKDKPVYKIQELISNIALCYTRLGYTDSALLYYQRAFTYINENSEAFGPKIMAEKAIGVIYGNMASIYIKKGDLDTAETLLKKSIAINVRPACENAHAQKMKLRLAEIYFKKNEQELLSRTLADIGFSLDTLPYRDVMNEWQKLMYMYYDREGIPAKSFEYYRKYIMLKDSLMAENTGKSQSDVMREMNLLEQQYQLQLLKKEKHVSRVYLLVTISFSILALAIVFLVYYSFKKSRKKNELISKQKDALEKINYEKDRILNVVATDLKSPVDSVVKLSETMLNDESMLPVKESFARIQNETQASLTLINELLGFNHDISKELKKETLDICALIKESVAIYESKATEKKVRLILELPDYPINMLVNRELARRVVGNLVDNAIKFSNEGGEVRVVLTENRGRILLEIKDYGIGIPNELIPAIFDRFTTSKRPGTAGEKSFGLGLSICKQVADAHDWKIWPKSRVGQGTTFFVEFSEGKK